MTTTTRRATAVRYHRHVSIVLLAAFALSAAYTLYGTLAGLPLGAVNATNPGTWVFYAVAFALALAVGKDLAAAWWALAALLPLLLVVGIFVYPSTFTPELQTPIGWLENDVYLGLLMVAAYLTAQRFRDAAITR